MGIKRTLSRCLTVALCAIATIAGYGDWTFANGTSAMLQAKAVASQPGSNDPATSSRAINTYGNLPLSFEKNQGQTDSRVEFLTRGKGYEIFVTPAEAV